MRIREVKKVFFSVLLTFVLLQSAMEATNYVILSWTEEGLRELRLAYRGRRLLATSLASVRSSNSVVFTRATNGIRLVETVIRYGVIDDCILSSSFRDVLLFSSEFSQLQPGKILHSESDILDVYLGIKNITDPVFLSKHSNRSRETTLNTSLITSNYDDVYTGYSSLDTVDDSVRGSSSVVLSAKITSARNSSFLHMFRPNLQVMKIARACIEFQKQAADNLEMLSLLLQLDSGNESSSVEAYLNNSARDIEALSRPHRHRHHHGRDLRHQRGTHKKDAVINDPHGGVQIGVIHSRHRQLSATLNDTEDNFVPTEKTPSTVSKHYVHKLSSGETENYSRRSVSSSETTYSSSQTDSKAIAPEHSTSVMPTNRSLENASVTHNKNNSGSNPEDDRYNEQINDMEKTVNSTTPSSPDALDEHHRRKRDLLTGWMIFPGTKWCGDGDIAENKNDMGYHVELDKCCRRHDLCPLVISRLTWKYGMFNYRLHTLSHCRCDRKFRKCLKASSSPLAHLIGQIYFNVVGPQCFKFNQKSTCVQRHWWGGCREYATSKVAFAKKQRRFK